MRHLKLFSILRHAFTMVFRTLKSYALLSVTIVLSLSLLLGYLLYTDTTLYNEYKDLFSQRRGDVLIADFYFETHKVTTLLDKIPTIGNSICYTVFYGNWGHHTSEYILENSNSDENFRITFSNLHAYFVPDHAWLDGFNRVSSEIIWVDKRDHTYFSLEADEVILSEKLYFALKLYEEEFPVFHLRSELGLNLVLKVVGYSKSTEPIDYMDLEGWLDTPPMILSTKLIDSMDLLNAEPLSNTKGNQPRRPIISQRFIVVYSDRPEEVVQLANIMKLGVSSVYEQQNAALEKIRSEKSNKAVIAAALLLLLGINLYSSFSNALNDRKFEIGVKRAIGASAWSIVRQFLYESILVMIANILISIALVADVFIAYKFIYERTPDEWGSINDFILYISPYSIAMFTVCSLMLTVVFSLIFAYKSTRVEIVRFLKAE